MFNKYKIKSINMFFKTFFIPALILAGFFIFITSAQAEDIIITEDTTWPSGEIIVIDGDEGLLIMPDVTLTIEEGVIVKLAENNNISIQGNLVINGSSEDQVIITSLKDDDSGGDTNGDGAATSPEPGDWGAIMIASENVNINMDYAAIKYGGGLNLNPQMSLHIIIQSVDQFTINHSQIINNKGAIMINEFNNFKINNSNIYNPDFCQDIGGVDFCGSAIWNTGATEIDVTNNYWGHPEGPTLDPQGELKGTFLMGPAIYEPFLTEPWQPEPPEPDPVIIVPGFLGSWYSEEEGWELDPILNTYDNLYKAMVEEGGYIPNETIFKFPYNWKQSNTSTASQLKQKIDEVKSICQCNKIDIVAHSMGGLVTRYYVESDYYNNDIDQIVFLGTPHKGAPKTYLFWEGADGFISPKEMIIKWYFKQESKSLGYETLFDYIQNEVKSLEQLLSDYAYLRDKGEINLRIYDKENYPDNYPYNNFLEELNSEENIDKFANSGVNIFNIIGDIGNETIGIIEVSSGEEYWPLWIHGYPEQLIKLAGDGTVPETSSSLFIPTKIDDTGHLALPTNAQKEIIGYLSGITPVYEIKDTPEAEEVLIIGVFSPVDFVIISPDGKRLGKDFLNNQEVNEIDFAFYTGFDTEEEFAVIINPIEGEYRIKLQGVGRGEYKLATNFADGEKEVEREFAGNIQIDQEQSFNFIYDKEAEEPISELEPEDNIPPIVSIINPAPDSQHLHSQNLIVDYEVTDDFSGVSSTVIKLDNQIISTTTIDLFYYDLGNHILNIEAVDKVGNSTSTEVNFEIITSIDDTIEDIDRIYELGWINKKYVKIILVIELKIIEKRLDIFAKQKEFQERLKQKIIDNPNIKEEIKKKMIERIDKRLKKIEEQRNKFIEKSLNIFLMTLNRFYSKGYINQEGYDIIKADINYLKQNL